ncbi:hypothetical protein FZEAL_7670 [Fusarium zealandicum]|uniref:1-alkyl-2-acetylglycerophosphocholine esterase n=1 Tax=Fusarium zealandicum TaxID=1053134 RepID=A0A8H4UG31_9HYPO|nr:hypothetical protein FZEAL_7670 [Fusarium zealandicum]
MRVLLLLSSLLVGSQALLLPKSNGPYGVTQRTHLMTDNNRLDPYSPNQEKRHILASIYWPVDADSCSKERAPYMPPATAEAYGARASAMGLSNDTFSTLEMEFCKVSKSLSACKNNEKPKFPVAVFSPGAGNSRLLQSAMARALSSYGHVVVLIDHPCDADIVEFPDGTIIPAADIPEDTANLEKATRVRAKDISFLVSELHRPSFKRNVLGGLPGKMDTNKITALGHSMGGASAAGAMLLDPRIRGGMNLDGRFFDPVLSQGLDKPFMMLGRPNHRTEDTTWAKFWTKLQGPKLELQISGTAHGSYTDVPLLLNALGLPKEALKATEPMFGSVDGKALQDTISKTLSAFMAYSVGGARAPLLKTIDKARGVSIVKKQLPTN